MKKVIIIGCGGAGKTTLAKQLAARLNLPLYHLDAYFWQPGWQEADADEFMFKHYELISQDKWIIDGNYRRTLSIQGIQEVWGNTTVLFPVHKALQSNEDFARQ